MMTDDGNERAYNKKLFSGTLRLNSKIFGLSLGLLCGLLIFIATNWLVLKGGETVGPHLSLLSQYFLGYEVTFTGSLIGFSYGFLAGATGGSLMGWIYNTIVTFRQRENLGK